jgi:hypothetical protein
MPPLGNARFIARIERLTGRLLQPGKRRAEASRTRGSAMTVTAETDMKAKNI